MNKPVKAIATLCLLNSASVYALGVGEIETHSTLNQLLKAKIPLVGSQKEDPSNIRIGIASREAFEKAGIDRPHYLTQLEFTPVLNKNGEITVDVRSSDTIKEPFVNFILEVEWPQGRTLKEFTILLDPPITMSDVKTTPLELPQVQVTKISPAAPTTSNTQTTSYNPTAKQAPPATEYGPTKSRDTLWGIAKKLVTNDRSVTHQQMMLALYDNNPKAFYKKNINALKKGAVLQVPSKEQTNSRSPSQANNEYAEQNALWSSSTKAVEAPKLIAKTDETDQPVATASNGKKKLKNNVEEAKLTLLTPEKETESEVPVEGNTSDTPVGSSNSSDQANIAIEMATTLEEENKEVKSRLNDLEAQVDKLQRLLALKDEQLAQLQSVKPADVADTKASEEAAPATEENNNLALYGGGLALALLGLFLVRRRKQNDELQREEQISEETPDFTSSITENNDTSLSATTILEEEPLLSEFTPSEFNSSTQTQEADPLTECDVYIAYGRFQQAEDLINKALEDDPDNQAYKFKLLDVYFASNNSEAFEDLANSLSTLKNSDPDTWSDIVDMGKDLCPESPLFATPQNEELDTSSDIEQEIDPGMSFEETDDVEEVKIEETPAESKENGDFDFDFDLIKPDTVSEDTHENIETLFSLAQASIEMEDFESARETLEQIIATGDEEEKQKAQEMLNEM